MKLGTRYSRTVGTGLVVVMVSALLISAGCDTNVQTTLLTGMNTAANAAATTLIDAAFQSMTPPAASTTGGTSNSGTTGSTTPSV